MNQQSAGRRKWNGRNARAPSVIGEMAAEEPEKAKVEILEAFERARGRMIGAAVDLALSRRHLIRLIWLLDIWPAVDEIRERWARGDVETPVTRMLAGSHLDVTPTPAS